MACGVDQLTAVFSFTVHVLPSTSRGIAEGLCLLFARMSLLARSSAGHDEGCEQTTRIPPGPSQLTVGAERNLSHPAD
jgi:hypothetical protein